MINNRIDLLGFQKNLNSQFLEIFESKKTGYKEKDVDPSSTLGLLDEINGLNFFLPLNQLKSISMTNTYEEIRLTDSWICGFNQVRGDIYTILDLNKVIDFLKFNKTNIKTKKLNSDNRIIYLKDYFDSKVGLIINNLLLEYTAQYTHILSYTKNTQNNFSWETKNHILFEQLVNSKNMSQEEYDLITKFKNFSVDKKNFDSTFFNIDIKNNKELLLFLISDIYLDVTKKRPIFTLNIEHLTKILLNASPF